ncbi:MAG: class I mannose-6-phosphate isomerase [Acidobacteriota bacterium]
MTPAPMRLTPSYRDKIWGATNLEPWFRRSESKIGEVWFTFDENTTDDGRSLRTLMREYGPEFLGTDRAWDSFPLLVKFIFTSDRLSVQVHPDDAVARKWEHSPGKTEMWHILRADPGAAIALGLKHAVTPERLREAALSGEIEDLLRWVPVRAGDTFFTAPGTIHAIGPGLALVEIQQNSDITYRLYDYGRPRELHLDKAIAVSDPQPHPGASKPEDLGGGVRRLVTSSHFVTDAIEYDSEAKYHPEPGRIHILIVTAGYGAIAGQPFAPGEVWLVPASAEPFAIAPAPTASFLRTYVPPASSF